MSSFRSTPGTSAAVGHWDGDEMELVFRYSYRRNCLPQVSTYLGLRDGMRVVDVGTGSTFFARTLARYLQRSQFTGLDADPKMIEVARRNVRDDGLEDRVRVVAGDAYDLPFETDAFDAATSHLLMCVLNDPQAALREQMRVVRPGGAVSAVICFCRTDGLPHYHGRWDLPGDHRIDALSHELTRAWRRTVRPRLLELDHTIVNQEVGWHFRQAGLQDLHINGHVAVSSPGDDRISVSEAAEFALAMHRTSMERLERQRAEHSAELAAAGFPREDFDELLDLMTVRAERIQRDPSLVREAMEIWVEPLLIIRGTVPEND